MLETPCFNCVPPMRHPGCYCNAKREWDDSRKCVEANRRAELRFQQYKADRIIAAKKRIKT